MPEQRTGSGCAEWTRESVTAIVAPVRIRLHVRYIGRWLHPIENDRITQPELSRYARKTRASS